tara:strand:- start:2028 stop:2219 length:192 start_codon:yes stop_codon:yes gene_type:complete
MSDRITITLKKETIQSAYNEMKLLGIIGAAYAQKDSPMQTLLMEIKRAVKKRTLWQRIKDYLT